MSRRRKQRRFWTVFMGGINGKFVEVLQADDDGSFVVNVRNERQPGTFASKEDALAHAESITSPQMPAS
jgi:hypothetical protein